MLEGFYFPLYHSRFISVPFFLPPHIHSLKMSPLFSLLPTSLTTSSPSEVQFKYLSHTHTRPSKTAVYCGGEAASSPKMGLGLASHPCTVPVPFSVGTDAKPHPDWAGASSLCIGAQKFYPLGVLKRGSCYHLPAERFAFEIDCEACSGRKGLFGKGLGRQDSEDLPLSWIAMQL